MMRAKADRRTVVAKERMLASFKGLEKGYGNALVSEEVDENVDDLIADLEDLNPTKAARDSEFLIGRWTLIFTSSSITRFGKGVSGIHLLFPFGRSIEVDQVIEPEDYRSYIVEKVNYMGGSLKGDCQIMGQYKWLNENRLSWQPEKLKLWFLRFQAESGWRGLGALRIVEVTYLDYELKIERGDVGQAFVWKRVE